MLKMKEMVPSPEYNPSLPPDWVKNRPLMWKYTDASRDLQVGDVVEFLCNGRGRGGHIRVLAKVIEINKKTFQALELPKSYSPGTYWTVTMNERTFERFGHIYINLSHPVTKEG